MARDAGSSTGKQVEDCEIESQTADEPLAGANIETIFTNSELVVVASVAETQDNVAIGPDDSLTYAVHSLKIDQVLQGQLPPAVDVAMMSHRGCHPIRIEGRAEVVPDQPAIWMLDKVDPRSGFDGYRLTAMPGLVPSEDGEIRMPEETVAGQEANMAGTIDELVETLID